MKKLAFILVLTPLLWGCSKKSPTTVTNTVYQSKLIIASIFLRNPGQEYFFEQVDIYSDPTPDPGQCMAVVKAGGSSFTLPQAFYSTGLVSFNDTARLPYPGIPCSLIVTTVLGSSRGGGISIPGSYSLITPSRGDTLPWGDVTVSWNLAPYATWYELHVSYTAYMGGIMLGNADTLIVATGSSTKVPHAFFRKYQSANNLVGWVQLCAHDGAIGSPGGIGNLTGDIKGFFYTTFEDTGTSYSRDFRMGSPKSFLKVALPPLIPEEKRRQYLLRAFGVA